MPELEDITKLPSYQQAHIDHRIALEQAGDDELAKTKAQLAWSEKTTAFNKELTAHNDSVRAVDQTRARMKEQFPDVPESIYAAALDPAAIESTAKSFDDALKAKVESSNPKPAPTPGTTGQPPTGVGGDRAPATDMQQRLQELQSKRMSGTANPGEIEELMDILTVGGLVPQSVDAQKAARR